MKYLNHDCIFCLVDINKMGTVYHSHFLSYIRCQQTPNSAIPNVLHERPVKCQNRSKTSQPVLQFVSNILLETRGEHPLFTLNVMFGKLSNCITNLEESIATVYLQNCLKCRFTVYKVLHK